MSPPSRSSAWSLKLDDEGIVGSVVVTVFVEGKTHLVGAAVGERAVLVV